MKIDSHINSVDDTNVSHKFNYIDKLQVETAKNNIKERLNKINPLTQFRTSELIEIVNKLSEFELGRFLLVNRGLNGYWTDYLINFPRSNINKLTTIEQAIFCSRPFIATFERQQIFKVQNQEKVTNGNHLASIPCGVMSEILDLDFEGITDINITGIDLDKSTFTHSNNKYPDLYKKFRIDQLCQDALSLTIHNKFDLISSNGLTIYIKDDDLVVKLLKNFHNALKVGGKLVTSFLTYPPQYIELTEQCTNSTAMTLETAIFVDILQVNWNFYRTSSNFKNLMAKAGFRETYIYWDSNKVFPTITAYK